MFIKKEFEMTEIFASDTLRHLSVLCLLVLCAFIYCIYEYKEHRNALHKQKENNKKDAGNEQVREYRKRQARYNNEEPYIQ